MAKQIIWVEESPQEMAVGFEAISWIFDYAFIGGGAPSAASDTIVYDDDGADVSGDVLSGSTSISGSRVTSKKFAPASAQVYTMLQPVTIDGNAVILGCKFRCIDPVPS